MKKQWQVIVGIILVFIVIIFAVINTEKAAVNFGFVTYQWPLIFVILGSFVLGVLIMLLSFYATIWKKNREIKQLQRELIERKQLVSDQTQQLEQVQETLRHYQKTGEPTDQKPF